MAGRVLTLREYESAKIGARWDPAERTIPTHVAAAVEQLQAGQRNEIFRVGRRTLQAQQFVGTVGVGDYAFEILPKVDQEDAATRANLVRMLSVAGLVPEVEGGLAALAASAPTLLDAFMGLYVRRLAAEWRRGRIANYRKEATNRTCLRGKLLFADQLRRNLLHPERFYTRADEFLQDVTIPRVLKAALQVCRRHSASQEVRRSALELLAEFEGITDEGFTGAELGRVRVDRRTARYGPLLELAKLLLAGRVPDRSGQGLTYSLVFDMNVVFERFIGRLLRRVVGAESRRARLQVGGRSLLLRDGKPRFGLRPDVGIYENQRLLCLVDTKWKRLEPTKPHEGVSQADMYQMYAYGKEYACPVVMLLYPQCDGLASRVACYHHRAEAAEAPRIEVCQVDVRQPAVGVEGSVAHQLRDLVAAAIGEGTELAPE